MKQKVFYFLVLIFLSLNADAQDHFLVDIKPLSPPIETLIKSFEGFPAIPVQANDINGKPQNIPSKNNKAVLMYFWDLECGICNNQIAVLNELQVVYANKLEILTFSNNSKEENIAFIKSKPANFSIIPNSRMLSDGPYQGDFGQPKIILIDEYGIIRKIFPQEILEQEIDFKKLITSSLSKL